jgi:restriction endonuclease S subunit
MADPYLLSKNDWLHGTLEPCREKGLIIYVESGGTPKTGEDSYWEGDIPWLTPKEITDMDGIFVGSTERNITASGLKNSAAKILKPGTVMLSKRAPVGPVAVNTVPMSTNQGFLNFKCGPLIRPLYLAYWFRINKPYLDAVANGSTYPELYKGDLFEFKVSVPSLDTQDEILQVISALQFSKLSGHALEQSVIDMEKLYEIRSESLKFEKTINQVMFLLFSGELSIDQLSKRLAS